MNKEELQNYINSFNKEPGTYTIEELISIGVAFEQLPRKQRNWDILHKQLGVYGFSAEAYRQRVQKYIRKNPGVLSESAEGEVYKNDYLDSLKVRDWYNAYRRDIREESRIDNLKDEIQKAADKFKQLPNVQFKGRLNENDKHEAVLLLSDLHIGVICDNYYNKYNKDVAKERLEKLLVEVSTYCKKNNVETLHILNMGDMIQGIIHTNARIENQMDVAEQIMIAGEYLASFLNQIQIVAPNITYRSVYDNHSRAIANLNEHIEKEQFSRIIDWFIKERLNKSNIKFIENDIDGGIGRFKLKSGKTLMFAHGHQDSKVASMQNFIGLTKEWVDYICLAHYHNSSVKEFQGCRVFINGSLVGTEQYAFGRRLFSKPSQKLLIFNNYNNTIQDIDIDVE